MALTRSLTRKEKEEFQKNREAYQKFLLEDAKTIEILDGIFGKDKYAALNTPEKRACWRAGYEVRGRSMFFQTLRSNLNIPWTALESGNVTEDDSYYYTLGSCMSKKDVE